jgi:hypothetical protein
MDLEQGSRFGACTCKSVTFAVQWNPAGNRGKAPGIYRAQCSRLTVSSRRLEIPTAPMELPSVGSFPGAACLSSLATSLALSPHPRGSDADAPKRLASISITPFQPLTVFFTGLRLSF